MKTKSTNRFVSAALALIMLLTCITFSPIVMRASAEETSGKYVLDANDLTAGDYANQTVTAGTDDYFTIYYGGKGKIDTSSAEFDDGYPTGNRFNFGGATKYSDGNRFIEFTTSGAGSVKIWWVAGDKERKIDLYSASKEESVASDGADSVKNQTFISTLKFDSAGKYYIGAPDGTCYIMKIEVTITPVATDYTLDANDLTAGDYANQTVTAGTDDYFTIYYGGKGKIDTSSAEFDDGYPTGNRFNFGGATKYSDGNRFIEFTASSSGSVKIWWVAGDKERKIDLYSASKEESVASDGADSVKNQTFISTLKFDSAGKYYIGAPDGTCYIMKVVVTEGAAEEVVRADWADVAAPAITSAKDDGKGNIVVNVDAVVGNDGGDAITVTMTDEAGNESTKKSVAEKSSHELTFTPSASGTYTFKAVLSRDGETDKESAAVTAKFVLPLGTPTISSVTNNGGGKVTVKWSKVDEADGYIIYAAGKEVKVTTNEGVVEGLTVGDAVEFTVAAVRGDEIGSKSAAFKATITNEQQMEWGFTAQGTSVSSSKNFVEGNLNEGSIKLTANAGKFNRAADDGYSFYYTAVPADKNFTFRAKVKVETWKYDNGQEGFGIAAVDSLAEKSFDTSHWSNFYMALVTRVEGVYNARLAVTTHSKTGITPENWQAVKDASYDRTLVYGPEEPFYDSLYDGKFNIVGNLSNPDSLAAAGYTTIDNITEFDLEITKNNTGFYTTYYDKDGNVVKTIKHWGTDDLTQLDKDYIYVGFVAARGATMSVTSDDYSLELRDPSEDPAPEEKPTEYVTPTVSVESSKTTNSTDYNLILKTNYKGTVTIIVNGTVVKENYVIGSELDSDGNIMENIIPVTIKEGANTISVSYKVDPSIDLGEGYEFDKTEASTSVTVTYETKFAKQTNLYVSPTGTKNGNGSKEYPLDLQTAMNVARPGQKIILMAGTYSAKTTFSAPRSVSGTKDDYIYMIADPEISNARADIRPVIDAEGNSGIGLDIVGDYWYIQGFDVCNAGSNGVRIAGSYCVADQIHSYENSSTGMSIQGDSKYSRLLWPSYNLIKNCEAYYNCDPGQANADGFSAKLIVGKGNVFDNCVSHHNSDDGWDLYGRNVTIEPVTIQNCVSYANGYLKDGTAGTGGGNGFKLGGDNNAAAHVLINSIAFNNLANGITCNSSPNIIVKNCTTYNNGGSGITLYTKASNTNFESSGVISYKNGSADNFEPQGSQDTTKVDMTYWDGKNGVADDWFENLTFNGTIARNADGSINMEGFLVLTDKAPEKAGAVLTGAVSDDIPVGEDDPSTLPAPETGFEIAIIVGVLAISAAAALVLFKKRRSSK